jgi:hypothetical protein
MALVLLKANAALPDRGIIGERPGKSAVALLRSSNITKLV